jgi:ethanolamine utilization protein EutA
MRAEHTTGFEALLRLPSLPPAPLPDVVIFSGGVSEYFYGRESRSYGDLGPLLARELATRMKAWGVTTEPSTEGIRATVIGASQYTVQVSGSTIFVSDLSVLPLRNIPAIKPPLALDAPDSAVIASAIRVSMARLGSSYSAIALCYSWNQSATFARLDAFCRGVSAAFGDGESSVPLILVGDSDVGGLIGLHFAEELKVKRPIVSIDGISLRDFDFIDIGAFLEGSGSLPVVVKSLIFPASHKSV